MNIITVALPEYTNVSAILLKILLNRLFVLLPLEQINFIKSIINYKKHICIKHWYFLPNNYFTNYKHLREVWLPDTIKVIDEKTFYEFKNLTDLKLPSEIEYINDYAFYGCENLKKIYFPTSIKYIGKYAFSNCVKLKKISVPNDEARIDDHAFDRCYELEIVDLHPRLYKIGHSVFSNCKKTIKNSLYTDNDHDFMINILSNFV